jgi:amino acid transporter
MTAVPSSQPGVTGTAVTAGHLQKALTALTNGALTFAGVGVFAGLFSLYGFAMNAAGPAEFWGWPVIALSVGMMVLVFAELASKYPFAGSMYQWPTILSGRRVGWWMGWAYAGALFPLMTAYYASLPILVRGLFDLEDTFTTNRYIIIFAAIVALIWNVFSIGILGRLAKWAMILELTVVTAVLLTVFVLGGKHFGYLTDAATVSVSASGSSSVSALTDLGAFLPLFLGAGIFNAVWVLYTFENGGTLGEETFNGERNAPRGIIGAYVFAVTCGFLFYFCLTPSIPDVGSAMTNYNPAESAILEHLPTAVLKLFLAVVALGLIVATNTMFTGAVRHIFGMARDGQVPFSSVFSRTMRDGSPWAAAVLLFVFSLIPVFVFGTKTASIVGGATGAMYLAYFAVLGVTLVARLRGWPRKRPVFSLGRWGVLINVLAVIGTGLTFVNMEWPRAATNPTYNQIAGTEGGIFFKDIPMGWILVGVPLLVGVVYYAMRHRQIHAQATAIEKYAVES